MLRLPVIIILVVSMFAGRVCPAQQREEHEKSKMNAVENLKIPTNTSSNSSKPVEPTIKATEDIKDENDKIPTTKSPTNVNTTMPASVQKTIENKTQDCDSTSTKEESNMLNCIVTPHDYDDIIEKNVPLNTTATVTTISASNKTETSTESQVPETTPEYKENAEKKNIENVVYTTVSTDQVSYDVVTAEPDHPTSINNSDNSSTNSKHTNSSDASNDLAPPPLLVNKIGENVESESIIQAIKSNDQVNKKRMPSGIIALVTAISFAVAVALVYVGLIVWRRYMEYRYGHRELLVNELEFDTNDLRHFEL